MRATSWAVIVALVGSTVLGGCASEYTIVDRSTVAISENARLSAASVLPGGLRDPRAVNHLALAQEVYQKQLDLLKERRNKVRARRRSLNLLSYGVLTAASLAAGAIAISTAGHTPERTAGIMALSGVGLGTGLEVGALMQEEPGTVDDKIRHLQSIYDSMLERVRVLAGQPQSEPAQAAIGAAIETFIDEALQINVKG